LPPQVLRKSNPAAWAASSMVEYLCTKTLLPYGSNTTSNVSAALV
jgi:hypothetical protein